MSFKRAKLGTAMRNDFFIQQWMEKYDINDLPWRKEIIDGNDPLGLFTDQPQTRHDSAAHQLVFRI